MRSRETSVRNLLKFMAPEWLERKRSNSANVRSGAEFDNRYLHADTCMLQFRCDFLSDLSGQVSVPTLWIIVFFSQTCYGAISFWRKAKRKGRNTYCSAVYVRHTRNQEVAAEWPMSPLYNGLWQFFTLYKQAKVLQHNMRYVNIRETNNDRQWWVMNCMYLSTVVSELKDYLRSQAVT